jgi:hypothetical protein
LDVDHPATADLPLSFDLISYLSAQQFVPSVGGALLPGAEIVMADLAEGNVAVTYEGASWRGVWFTGMPDYQSAGVDAEVALYNAIVWASGPG